MNKLKQRETELHEFLYSVLCCTVTNSNKLQYSRGEKSFLQMSVCHFILLVKHLLTFLPFCSPRLHLFDQKYSKNSETLLQFKIYCNFNFIISVIKAVFSASLRSLQCHMIFRNHSNMLIYCSWNISDYYQCWKQLCCFIFCGNRDTFNFSGFFD